MKLGTDQVKHVAQLARVGVSEDEAVSMADELSAVLDYVETLGEVDVEGVAETASVTGTHSVVREDVVTCEDKRDEMLGMSSRPQRGGQVLVDNIL